LAANSSLTANSSLESAGFFVGRWWTVLLRGLTAVAFGLLAFLWPHKTVATLATVFGLYALAHGIFSLTAAIGSRGERGDRWLLAFEGAVGICAGVLTLRAPSIKAMLLVLFIWLWAVGTGALRIAEAVRLRKMISGEPWLALSGVVTLLFGSMALLGPLVGTIGLAWMIAGYALVLGLFEIMLGRELRAFQSS
jgi:uncharacterized membrane protein HdeD (DUF308 family)